MPPQDRSVKTVNEMTAEQIYEQHIKQMSPAEQLRLMRLMTWRLAGEALPDQPADKQRPSITELHGLGAEIWGGVDAQEYVNTLRQEWNHHS